MKKRTKEDKKKLALRIIAIFLAVLMVLGVAYYTIMILASAINADAPTEQIETLDTSSLKAGGDVLISVGITYDATMTTSYAVSSATGFRLGSQELDGERRFEELWELPGGTIVCASEGNLTESRGTYSIASRERDTDIGGNHIEIDCWDCEREDLVDLIGDNERSVNRMGYDLIPAYIDGYYMLRIGDFTSERDARDALEDLEDLIPRRRMYIVEPTDTGVTVFDPDEETILFEYDCRGDSELGIAANEDRHGNTYLTAPSGNIYDGVFAFRRVVTDTADGISVINIIPLEAYIAGVLPYETSNAWPIETQKAFAITVRSFSLTNMKANSKHWGHKFDLCTEVCCQVYRGAAKINDAVMEAVLGTEGEVMTYGNKIVVAYYVSSMGGVTVSAQDAWGGADDIPYLQPIETPWEDYMNHENAFWISEISPSALCDRLNLAGYKQLRGEIESAEILEYARDSTYIKTLRVTDTSGTTVDITPCDSVRISLTPYVKSANFVIGRGSVEYTEDVVVSESAKSSSKTEEKPKEPDSYGIDYAYMDLDDFYVITEDAEERTYFGDTIAVLTENGQIDYQKRDIFAVTRQNAAA
ncbi:MAG: SpoIID/LytB domain-containing protein, partial [Clostridia bacterium]|nr:SpoIID/LytB domain-containing protein [Clostridia bacterium]